MSVVHLPVGPCLEALRDALKTVLGPESQSALGTESGAVAGTGWDRTVSEPSVVLARSKPVAARHSASTGAGYSRTSLAARFTWGTSLRVATMTGNSTIFQ